MIKLDNISKTYQLGKQTYVALKNISLTIHPGECVAIVGASGSGKTTTMNVIGLLDKPTSGKYFLNDVDTSHFSGDELAQLRNQHIGFIFQLYFLLPKLTALENVMLPLTYRHSENKMQLSEMQKHAITMLEKVGMETHAHHRPMELSGGQQQRVAIARALVNKPSIILADEPTGALDSHTSQNIMNLLKQAVVDMKTTVVIITHSNDIAAQCDRAIRICDGEIV